MERMNREPGLLGAVLYGLITYYIIAYIPLGYTITLIAPFIAGLVVGATSKTVKQSTIAGFLTGLFAPLLIIGARLLLTGSQVLTITKTGILWTLPFIQVFAVILITSIGVTLILRNRE
ncbi:MAG: hypothetical protein F7B59_08050 [Desulfurococcales archaeon]|nr:hypothetical protein [Desulfurococcales archaeon]